MAGVNVKSEIAPLKKVLLHRPGNELLNLTPNTLGELLFDDIPFLPVAQEEHDSFSAALRDHGVEVVYLEDLMTEVLDDNPDVREQFLKQFIEEAGIRKMCIRDRMREPAGRQGGRPLRHHRAHRRGGRALVTVRHHAPASCAPTTPAASERASRAPRCGRDRGIAVGNQLLAAGATVRSA